jgi:acetyl esterase/lipase
MAADDNGFLGVDSDGTIHLGPRVIPPPASISAEARVALALPRPQLVFPAPNDKEGWRRHIAETNARFQPLIDEFHRLGDGAAVTETTIGGVRVQVGAPSSVGERTRNRALITVHGGAFAYLAGPWVAAEAKFYATRFECLAYAVDYRILPDHPYPAAVDDVVAVYRGLLQRHKPTDVALAGGSAGANLIAAAMLKARDLSMPLPAALLLNSPVVDLCERGDTAHTLRHIDSRLPHPVQAPTTLYVGGNDPSHPYLSPVYGDFTAGFPPTYIQTGTRDLLLSMCVRLHRALRAAGVHAELHAWEGAPHGGFGLDAPETAEAYAEQSRFLTSHWGI